MSELATIDVERQLSQEQAELVLSSVLGPQWRDPHWRIANLYWIVNERGERIRFIPNEEQSDFLANLWHRNIILKARQLGFSTLMALLELDQALFNANYKGSIIADTLPNAGNLFGKVEYAYENLPTALRAACPLKEHAKKSSMTFAHRAGESSVTVAVSNRGGTLQLLHVSELGKIARRFPRRAEEIVSGAFPAAEAGVIVVESTAEGPSGEFFDLCEPAMERVEKGEGETRLDYRLHFYPWFRKAAYRLSDEDTKLVRITDKDTRYFNDLERALSPQYGADFRLDDNQRAWYVKTRQIQKSKMKREYPSTPQEAFEATIEGAIYGTEMATVREHGRITDIALDPTYPVNTFWDLGTKNAAVWLHQLIGMRHVFVAFFDNLPKRKTEDYIPPMSIGRWWRWLEQWRAEHGEFLWGKHYMPHDADTPVQGEDDVLATTKELFEKAGARNVVVVPRIARVEDGIEMERRVLDVNCWFDRKGCVYGIRALDSYQFEWDEMRGTWKPTPLHNWASHGADAKRQFAQALEAGLIDKTDAGPSLRDFKGRQRSWYR